MRNHLIYLILTSTIIFSCSKKKIAVFCPSEKNTSLIHKPISSKEKQKVFAEQKKGSETKPSTLEKSELEASQESEIYIDDNPVKERIKSHQPKHMELMEPEEPMDPHRGSISAFVIFFLGALIGVSVVGMVWAIYNLFFLANKKDKFKLKGFSLAVVITSMLIFAFIGLILYILQAAFYYDPAMYIIFGLLGFLFFTCAASIFYYFAGSNLFK